LWSGDGRKPVSPGTGCIHRRRKPWIIFYYYSCSPREGTSGRKKGKTKVEKEREIEKTTYYCERLVVIPAIVTGGTKKKKKEGDRVGGGGGGGGTNNTIQAS